MLGLRVLKGLGGGVLPVLKAYMNEISNDRNVAIIYSYIGIGNGFAELIGPALAGWLSHPADKFGGLEFLREYPYIIPMTLL